VGRKLLTAIYKMLSSSLRRLPQFVYEVDIEILGKYFEAGYNNILSTSL
jgi:hypothetical protein